MRHLDQLGLRVSDWLGGLFLQEAGNSIASLMIQENSKPDLRLAVDVLQCLDELIGREHGHSGETKLHKPGSDGATSPRLV